MKIQKTNPRHYFSDEQIEKIAKKLHKSSSRKTALLQVHLDDIWIYIKCEDSSVVKAQLLKSGKFTDVRDNSINYWR